MTFSSPTKTVGAMADLAHAELYEWAARECPVPSDIEAMDAHVRGAAVMDLLARRVAECHRSAEAYVDGTREYLALSYEPRALPTGQALDVLDRVKAHVETVKLPRCVVLEVGPVVRVTRHPPGTSVTAKFTAVVVRLRSPVTADRFVVVRAE